MLAEDPVEDMVVDGRYRILRKLGEGGMSIVYEVQHLKLNRSFALKQLLPRLVHHEEALQRFEREAELLASLRHPHVVDITDWVLMPDGTPCMILEFLHGASLNVRIQREPLPWEEIAWMGDQAMSALALAHRIGITHRDLKPENIYISIDDAGDERVKLLDFGISKLRGMGGLSGIHSMLGTPSYMSPEQASGNNDVGPETDVWAMGAILYEMATQRVAFDADGLAETLVKITSSEPDPILAFRPDASPAFVELIERALSRDPERRITTIEELRNGLRTACEPRASRTSSPVIGTRRLTPIPIPVVEPSVRPTPYPVAGVVVAQRPSRWMWWGVGLLLAVAVTLLNVFLVR